MVFLRRYFPGVTTAFDPGSFKHQDYGVRITVTGRLNDIFIRPLDDSTLYPYVLAMRFAWAASLSTLDAVTCGSLPAEPLGDPFELHSRANITTYRDTYVLSLAVEYVARRLAAEAAGTHYALHVYQFPWWSGAPGAVHGLVARSVCAFRVVFQKPPHARNPLVIGAHVGSP